MILYKPFKRFSVSEDSSIQATSVILIKWNLAVMVCLETSFIYLEISSAC